MSFQDLPRDWPTRPVTDPLITADLLDLLVGDRDRHSGAIGVMLCGAGARLLQPVVVSDPPANSSVEERRVVFDALAPVLAEHDGPPYGAGILVAVARPGSPLLTAGDRSWREAAEASCADHHLLLHGVWLMTPEVIRPVPPRRGRELRSA